ncbi:MAG: hypothetical protein ACI4BI_04610 [Anaerotardibacter sp.]
MSKLIKVGSLPGKIQEVAVEVGTSIEKVLEIAGFEAGNKEIKVDGVVATESDVVTDSTKLVLLVQKIKGNGIVKCGSMPGRIQEVAVEDNATVAEILEVAGLEIGSKEVKVDGVVADENTVAGTAKLVLLVQKVKGNAIVKAGVMPGKIGEYAVEDNATVADILEIADLDATGYEIKVDGQVSELGATAGTAKLVLLARKVKGNN